MAFLGQSVVEALNGKHDSLDMIEWEQLQQEASGSKSGSKSGSGSQSRRGNGYGSGGDYFGHVNHMFQKRFQSPSEMNHNLYGVAMGIAGDQAGNVLWRLKNGEMNKDFNPPVWWIVAGMEEVGRYRCSEEIVIMGILRIVEEIKNVKPDAKIVINGLFPMVTMRTEAPEPEDFMDAERSEDGDGSDDDDDNELDERPHRSSHGHRHHGRHRGRHRNHRGDHLILRKLRRHHRHRHHHDSEDEPEDYESIESEEEEEEEYYDEEFESERKYAKRFKKDKLEQVHDHFEALVESNRQEENHLKEMIHSLKHDRHSQLTRDQKHQRLDEMSEALAKMKRSHASKEDSMRSYIREVARDTYNPVMKERHSFRKNNLFHHHNNRDHLPVWTVVHEINRQLHEFCKNTEQVTFYDPTHLFTQRTENGELKLLTDLISPRGHPTQWGMKLWLNEIQRKLIGWKIEAENEAKGDYSNIVENSEDDWEASNYIINHHYYGEKMEEIEEETGGGMDMDSTDEMEDTPEVQEGEEDEESEDEESEDEESEYEDESEDEGEDEVEIEEENSDQEVDQGIDEFVEVSEGELNDSENGLQEALEVDENENNTIEDEEKEGDE